VKIFLQRGKYYRLKTSYHSSCGNTLPTENCLLGGCQISRKRKELKSFPGDSVSFYYSGDYPNLYTEFFRGDPHRQEGSTFCEGEGISPSWGIILGRKKKGNVLTGFLLGEALGEKRGGGKVLGGTARKESGP